MKTFIFSVLFTFLFTVTNNDILTGKWQSPVSPQGNVTSIIFKPDQSFEGFVNNKPFVTGNYSIKDSIFTFTDNGCNGSEGSYKLIFFQNGDSLRFQYVSDTCMERRNGVSRLVLGRKPKL
jgi:hypothetical protein